MVLISAMVCVYYNVIIMYALLYIFLSLVNIGWPVPWASCGNDWNTEDYCRTTALPDLESIVSITERISTSLGKYSFKQRHWKESYGYMRTAKALIRLRLFAYRFIGHCRMSW